MFQRYNITPAKFQKKGPPPNLLKKGRGRKGGPAAAPPPTPRAGGPPGGAPPAGAAGTPHAETNGAGAQTPGSRSLVSWGDPIVGVHHKSAIITFVGPLSKAIIPLKPEGGTRGSKPRSTHGVSVPRNLFKSITFVLAKNSRIGGQSVIRMIFPSFSLSGPPFPARVE